MGKSLAQGVHKASAALCDTISFLILGEVDAVHILRVRIHHLHFVPDAQILTDATDIPVLLHTTDNMHTGIEQDSEAPETLKASADDGILFKHSDFQPLLGEDGTGEQAAKTTANDDYALVHTIVCSTLSAISVYLLL